MACSIVIVDFHHALAGGMEVAFDMSVAVMRLGSIMGVEVRVAAQLRGDAGKSLDRQRKDHQRDDGTSTKR